MSKKKNFPMRIPRYATGIRLQGAVGGGALLRDRWWARRWVETLNGMNLGARLGRGRNYAVRGQVVALDIDGPQVRATIVGGRADPYSVTINFRTPDDDARKRIIESIRSEPMFVARLVVGDMPTELESLFRAEGFTLFPGGKLAPGKYDMTTRCSCPDWANPCKHSVAVLLLLGEEIARRPMTLLELRGIRMKDLCDED